MSIEKALGSNNDNVDKTQYFKGDNDRTLRLANHRCNCRMFLLHDHTTKNTSIVVKLSEKAFKGNKNVDAIEYVYFPDKLTKEVQLNILEGIKEWIDNGEYDKKCDQINISTIQNGIRKHVVRHGELEDAEIESLIAYIQEKIETIENETTDGIYNLLRKMAELNYNAYKGRGSSRFGFTTKIYKVKNVAVPKIANELLSRGEYVGFDREQRIIYFKDNNEHQISFHGFYEPNFSEELRDKVEYEAKWDGIKESWRKEEDYRILRERQKQREKIQAEIDILTQHFYKENAVLTEQKYPWDLDYSSVIRDMAITGWSSQSYAKDAFNAFIAKSDEAKRLLEEQKKLKAQEDAIPYSEIQNKLYSLEAKLKRLRKPESIEKTTKDIIELQKQKKETWKEILLLRDKIKGIGEEMVLLYHKLREQKRPEVERVNREMEVKREDYKNKIEILKNQELPKLNALRFFRTANGEAYGFTVDGKIYLDPTIAGAETAIHEYTHLWATALKNANPKEWSNIVSLLKGTPIWDKVASEYPELTTDDELADEVLAHYSGKRGAERLRKEAESIANGKGSLLDKAGAISALERVKEALTRFWKATADLLHIHFTTAEEVADKVLADLLNGVNPNEVAKDKNLRFQLIGEQGAEESTSGEDLEEMNARFNEELQQQIDGTLPQGHIYQLGMASAVLQSAGLPNLPIELSASRLKDKSMQEEHPFELSEMRGLVDSVQNPLAVFRSATHIGSFVVLTEIEHQGKNFVVAIQANRRQGRIEINSIRSVHNRNKNTHIANWITEGLLEYADKKRMAEWLSKQRYNSADVRKLFNHATKIVNEFDNPIINEENLFRKPVGGNSGYVGYSMSKRAEQAREDGRFPKTDFKREYKVSESSLQALSRIGIISDNEWHHTSSYGNKTTFYGWADEAFAEYYLEHKKEIDKATDDLLRLKEEDIDKYFSALDDFRKEMRKSFDVGTSGLSKSKYDFEQELRSRTSDEVVAEYQRQKSEYTSTESNPKPFPSILKWQSQNKDLVKEIENKVRQEMDQSSAIADSVRSLAERLHLDNVEIVTDASALSGKEAKAKGFYTKSTGKITIVVPNNISAEDAVQTLLHEAVAHYGLRQLFGSEFDNFLDAVLENADKEVLERIYDLAQANGWDYRKATEQCSKRKGNIN